VEFALVVYSAAEDYGYVVETKRKQYCMKEEVPFHDVTYYQRVCDLKPKQQGEDCYDL
jgi:hypothetical protein